MAEVEGVARRAAAGPPHARADGTAGEPDPRVHAHRQDVRLHELPHLQRLVDGRATGRTSPTSRAAPRSPAARYTLNRENLTKWIMNAPSMIPMASQGLPAAHRPTASASACRRSRRTRRQGQKTMTQQDAEHDRRLPAGSRSSDRGSPPMTTVLRAPTAPRHARAPAAPEVDHRASGAGSPPSTTRRSASSTARPRSSSSCRRHRGAADPPAARAARTARVLTAAQYNTLFTMHGTTMVFLVGMPLRGRVRQLLRPAADRRARRRVPAAQHVRVLGVPLRRPVHLLELRPRRRAERRVVRLHAAHQHADRRGLPARATAPTSGPSASSCSASGPSTSGDQLHRHHPQHARARA